MTSKSISTNLAPFFLFGNTKHWLPPPWTTTDDRIRGGSSRSSLSSLPLNGALFQGNLDTKTLGGAGFASQFSPDDAPPNEISDDEGRYWDLSGYDGIEVEVGKGDGKLYTLILKDEASPGERNDGREKAGISWEVEFKAEEEGKKVWTSWGEFKATYRGKEKKDVGELKTGSVCRVGIMMRSYFGTQEGDFRLELKSISARNRSGDEAEKPRMSFDKAEAGSKGFNEKSEKLSGEGAEGWKEWLRQRCIVP